MLWLEHHTTGSRAAIDVAPEPGGNVIVLRDGDGHMTGLYSVATKDTIARLDGRLHVVHQSSCRNATARRMRREAGRDRAQGTVTSTPTRRVPCARPGCPYPLPSCDIREGFRFHACCEPYAMARLGRKMVTVWSAEPEDVVDGDD